MMQLTHALFILNVPYSLGFFFPVLSRNAITVAPTDCSPSTNCHHIIALVLLSPAGEYRDMTSQWITSTFCKPLQFLIVDVYMCVCVCVCIVTLSIPAVKQVLRIITHFTRRLTHRASQLKF
jgi:hypothetical protein